MAEEEKKEKRYEVETTREVAAARKKKMGGITFRPYIEDVRTRAAKIEGKRKEIIEVPASEKLLARARSMGKLTARERLDRLFDKGTFVEHSIFAESQITEMGMKERRTPADGCIIGFGEVNGKAVVGIATDYTVMAGAMGEAGLCKMAKAHMMAGNMKIPIVTFVDSGGARLTEAAPGMRWWFELYWCQCAFSGFIPQICIVCGGCAAGQAYFPNLVDWNIMTRNAGSMWIGGPRATMAITGAEDITEIGGADYHMQYSGSCHYAAANDDDAIEWTKKLLSYLPANCEGEPPRIKSADDPNRQEERLLDILPEDPRRTYDMHEIINLIIDNGDFLEIQEGYAPNAIIGFCRFDGYACGICAGNPAYIAGCMDTNACDKYSRFITFCDCFNIPIIFLVDNPALLVGDEWERKGITRYGAKLLNTVNNTTVPKITILVRKAYGGTTVFFFGLPKTVDFCYAWPTAEYAPMGPDGAVAIIYDRQIKELHDSESRLKFAEEKKKEYFDEYTDPFNEVKNMRYDFFDDIIDPRNTRKVIINALQLSRNKDRTRIMPKKRRTNRPI